MIVGYSSTLQSKAARCIQAIGRESTGGPVAKDFIARVDKHEHESVKNMIKNAPLSAVCFFNDLHEIRLKDNRENVQAIAQQQCVKFLEAEIFL